jgi:hypothetical protein
MQRHESFVQIHACVFLTITTINIIKLLAFAMRFLWHRKWIYYCQYSSEIRGLGGQVNRDDQQSYVLLSEWNEASSSSECCGVSKAHHPYVTMHRLEYLLHYVHTRSSEWFTSESDKPRHLYLESCASQDSPLMGSSPREVLRCSYLTL